MEWSGRSKEETAQSGDGDEKKGLIQGIFRRQNTFVIFFFHLTYYGYLSIFQKCKSTYEVFTVVSHMDR